MTSVILASASTIRSQILAHAGVRFETFVSVVDESAEKAWLLAQGSTPSDVARALADAKAVSVSRTKPGFVIGADQTLEFQGDLFDKVSDLRLARERLRILRGRTHTLHTATAVARDGLIVWRSLKAARLTMRPFSDSFLDNYICKNGRTILSSVGCYQIESEGLQLFERVDGDYFDILGLCLIDLLGFLRTSGILMK